MSGRVTPAANAATRRGFTLVESLIAVSLTTLAGGALLSTIGSTVQISTDSTYTVIAQGMADQMMDEVASVKFPQTSGGMGPSVGPGRTGFDDLDDYHGWNASPPQTRDGMALGTERMTFGGTSTQRPNNFQADPRFVSRFRQQVSVEKIAEASGMYTRLERFIKRHEGRIGSCVGADGAIFAVRKTLYQPLQNDDINDLVIPLNVVRQGYRVSLDDDLYCYETSSPDSKREFQRQIRITNRTLRALFRHSDLMNIFILFYNKFDIN